MVSPMHLVRDCKQHVFQVVMLARGNSAGGSLHCTATKTASNRFHPLFVFAAHLLRVADGLVDRGGAVAGQRVV